MDFEFVDFATKAKELGITESTFRAKVLSSYDAYPCFIHLSYVYAFGAQTEFLPAWSKEEFPYTTWEDVGCQWEVDRVALDKEQARRPRYYINGWVVIGNDAFGEILFRGKRVANETWVWVLSHGFKKAIPVVLQVSPDKEWVECDGYEEGGYFRDVMPMISKGDLYWHSRICQSEKSASSRKDRSYLGIIAAMRALLMAKDGGAFPSQAKIIDELERRYSNVDGVSKRNLEKVFAESTRTADIEQRSQA